MTTALRELDDWIEPLEPERVLEPLKRVLDRHDELIGYRCSECGFAEGEYPNAPAGTHLRDLADVAARSIVHEFYDPDNSWVTKYGWEKHLSDTIYQALAKSVAEMKG